MILSAVGLPAAAAVQPFATGTDRRIGVRENENDEGRKERDYEKETDNIQRLIHRPQ